jgi:basic amino acid/polyamine antiporter, APA family
LVTPFIRIKQQYQMSHTHLKIFLSKIKKLIFSPVAWYSHPQKMNTHSQNQSRPHLERGLALGAATAIVVGTIIGTGVFLKSATMGQHLGSVTWVLLAWAVAGVLSMAGAFAYAELGRAYPEAGGEYVYLRNSYGDAVGFLYGWMRFWIASPGSIAAYAVGGATFLNGILSLQPYGGPKAVAIFFIMFFTALNNLKVHMSGQINALLTWLKLALICILPIGVAWAVAKGWAPAVAGSTAAPGALSPSNAGAPSFNTFGLALLSALWAYDGWNNLGMVGGEIKNARRNLPLALIFGIIIVMVLYLCVNASYFWALPFEDAIASNSALYPSALPIATRASTVFLSENGIMLISGLFLFSALAAMNGSILTNARVPYALAENGFFPRILARLNKHAHVPGVSLWVQGVVSCALAFLGTFDQLTDYVVFASWIFYGLCAAAVVRLKREGLIRWAALLFTIASILLLGNTLYTMPKESLIGLLLIGLGWPYYKFLKRFKLRS